MIYSLTVLVLLRLTTSISGASADVSVSIQENLKRTLLESVYDEVDVENCFIRAQDMSANLYARQIAVDQTHIINLLDLDLERVQNYSPEEVWDLSETKYVITLPIDRFSMPYLRRSLDFEDQVEGEYGLYWPDQFPTGDHDLDLHTETMLMEQFPDISSISRTVTIFDGSRSTGIRYDFEFLFSSRDRAIDFLSLVVAYARLCRSSQPT